MQVRVLARCQPTQSIGTRPTIFIKTDAEAGKDPGTMSPAKMRVHRRSCRSSFACQAIGQLAALEQLRGNKSGSRNHLGRGEAALLDLPPADGTAGDRSRTRASQ
jgi:hypothetical protein